MKENPSYKKPVYFIASFLILLIVLAGLSLTSLNLAGWQTKKFPFETWLRPESRYSHVKHYLYLAETKTECEDGFRFINEEPLLKDFSISNETGICVFMQKLNQSKVRKIRVAYFGDSMIEGDLITQTLRELMQKKFGGSGVGLVPLTSVVAGFRQSISHQFDGNWKQSSLIDYKSKPSPGVMGYCFLASADSLGMQAAHVSYYLKENNMQNCTVLYGKNKQPIPCIVNYDGKVDSVVFPASDKVNFIHIDGIKRKSISFTFPYTKPLPLYGVTFEDTVGVYIDNLAFRGNSGLALDVIPPDILSETQAVRPYDLIVLQYGINVVSDGMKSYSWYKTGMSKIISKFKNAMPGVPIIIAAVADKSIKDEHGYHTPEALKLLVNTQEALAREHQCIFFNVFEAMGGEGSMIQWVQTQPPLANLDYTHLNFRGAKKAASLFFDALITEKKACDLHSKTL